MNKTTLPGYGKAKPCGFKAMITGTYSIRQKAI
jgi:hypothetical protein